MATWNDSAPDTIGLEWFATTEGTVLLDSPLSEAALKIGSTGAETIDQIVHAHQYVNAGASGYSRHWVDVYDLSGSPAPGIGGVTELSFSPNEDKTRSGTTKSDFATTTNLFQAIDDADDGGPPEATDYVVNSNYGSAGSYLGLQFNTAAIPSSWRIVYVKFEVRAKGFDWSWQQPTIYLDWYNGSTKIGRIPGASISPPQDYVFRTSTFGPYYFDFYNEGTWLQPEIANLDNNTLRNLRLVLNYACAVSRVTMKVGVIPENRVAVGISSKVTVAPSGVQTNTPLLLKTPLGVDNWSKPASGNFLAAIRRLEDPFQTATTLTTQALTLDSGSAAPIGEGTLYAGAVMADQSGVLSSIGTPGTAVMPFWLGTSGGAQSNDEQPYRDIEAKPVSWNTPVAQQVSGASAQSYRRLRALVGKLAGSTPGAALRFGVRRTSVSTGLGDASETWTGTNGNPWPAQWTSGAGTTGADATIQTNAGQMVTGTVAAGYYRHLLNVALNANLLVQTSVTFASVAAANSARIFLGGSTFTNGVLNSGYELRLTANTNTVALYSTDGAGAQTLITSFSFTFAAATVYQVKLMRIGDFIGIRIWTGTETEGWTWTATSSLYTVSRLALGVLGGADPSSDTITFDTLSVWNYLTIGDLSTADLSDTGIATSKGTRALGPGTLDVYDVMITMDNAATLASATDYTIEVAAGADPAVPWYLLWLDATASHALTGNKTYQGSTDAAAAAAAAYTAGADFMITLATVPVAPSSVTATVQSRAFDDNGGALCDAGSLEFARVTWVSGGALGAKFSYWEVQRSYDNGSTWEAAAQINTEATLTWDNKEVRRGIAVKYRVRAVRTDGAASDWTTQTGTITVAAASGVLAFVSDADQSVIGGFVLLGAQRKYGFRDRTVYADVHGRDFPLAFKDGNQRGFAWDFRVLIFVADDLRPTLGPAGGAGVRAFDPIRAIARADVPYLAVLTPDGEVLCGSIDVPEGPRAEPGHYYEATVSFVQTQDAPSSVSV